MICDMYILKKAIQNDVYPVEHYLKSIFCQENLSSMLYLIWSLVICEMKSNPWSLFMISTGPFESTTFCEYFYIKRQSCIAIPEECAEVCNIPANICRAATYSRRDKPICYHCMQETRKIKKMDFSVNSKTSKEYWEPQITKVIQQASEKKTKAEA